MTLPDKLEREPLMDCVFEIRFKSDSPASSLLPGFIFAHLPDEKKLERLPHGEIPATIRAANPDLRYAPLFRINWMNRYFVGVGDYNLSVSTKIPYPGWAEFKPAILSVLQILQNTTFVTAIERFAYKTTNVFEADLGAPSQVVKFAIHVGDNDFSQKLFHIRGESKDADFIKVVQVATEATVNAPGVTKVGVLLDLDVISNTQELSREIFLNRASDLIQAAHDENKKLFFSCITEDVLRKLGPIYDASK